MPEPQRSPLASLVLFMFCLSIAGSALAGAHYYAVDLPAQKNLQALENSADRAENCNRCLNDCKFYTNTFVMHKCIQMCRDLDC